MGTNEALKIAEALKPVVESWIEEKTRSAVRARKMNVTTAPAGGVIGVTEGYGGEITIPCSSSLSGVTVGSSVWVVWLMDDMSTAVALWSGSIV